MLHNIVKLSGDTTNKYCLFSVNIASLYFVVVVPTTNHDVFLRQQRHSLSDHITKTVIVNAPAPSKSIPGHEKSISIP